MKTTSSLIMVCLLGTLVVPSAHGMELRPSKQEQPLLTTAERSYWPFTPTESQRRGAPLYGHNSSLPTLPGAPGKPTIKFIGSEETRYRILMMSRQRDCEPVGIVFRPDEDFPVNDEAYLRAATENKAGPELPMFFMADEFSRVSKKFVLVSARVEKRSCDEFKAAGSPVEVVDKMIRKLAKQGLTVLPLGPDCYVMIESPDKKQPFPYDRSRAAEYTRDREAWFTEKPNYVTRGLIYQPTVAAGNEPQELQWTGKQVRHVAEALATFTQKEVFVEPRVEKRKIPTATFQGTREEIMNKFNKWCDKADVRLIELGPDNLALLQE